MALSWPASTVNSSAMALLGLIGSVDPQTMLWGLFAAHVASRGFPLLLIRAMAHVGDEAGSKSKPLADRISGASLLVAAMWLAAALLLAAGAGDGLALVTPLACAALAWLWMWRWFRSRLQGFTGDCLGATQQVCEVAFYFGLALTL